MKNLRTTTWLISALLILLYSSCRKESAESARTRENIGSDWLFKKVTDMHAGIAPWDTVNLPHTTHIEPLVVNNQWQGTATYKKYFNAGDLTGKKVFIYFEGVMQEAVVTVNYKEEIYHAGGYLPFTVDATPYLKPNDENVIKVKIRNTDNPQIPPGKALESLDFNYYGGIYRNVYLITTGLVHVTDPVYADIPGSGGLLIHFDSISEKHAEGFAQIHVKNEDTVAREVDAKIILTAPTGNALHFRTSAISIDPGKSGSLMAGLNIDDPELWSPDHPHLYNLRIQVFSDGRPADEIAETTGIRKADLRTDGFYLNGEKMFIRGTNRHQEYPYIGYALSDEAQWRDAVKIKNAGFDFVRLSHYPHAEAFMDACDALGLMTMNAIPGWQFFGDSLFVERALQDCRDLIRRDRNHPSVIFWELSLNESPMTDEFMQQTAGILREELPFEDAYNAGWLDHPAYDLFIPARQHAKPPDYWNFYKDGKRKIFIAEYGDWEYYAQNAGFNQKAFADLKAEERNSRQLRDAGEVRLLQQALNFQEAANSNRKGIGTIGHANWLMFDYNRGYADNIEASGISDIFRLPKLTYYFYQSQRPPEINLQAPLESGPMVFIASYWNEASPTDIKIFSNCEEVELALNGKVISRQKPEINPFSDHLAYPPFIFQVDGFEPGTLTATGYIDDSAVATHEVTTAGPPAQIRLEIDESGVPVSKNTPDVLFIYAHILDESGHPVFTATNEIEFSVEGEAELIGMNPVRAEAGIASILLKINDDDQRAEISATSHKLTNDIGRLNHKN